MDDIERKLLALLQENAELSNAELGERVGLSTAGVHRRIRRLREKGYIEGVVARLNKARLGLDLLCYLHIIFKNNMNPDNMRELARAIGDRPEVLECYTLTGSDDALMKVLVRDHSALKALLVHISKSQDVIQHVTTSIALDELKETAALPLDRIATP